MPATYSINIGSILEATRKQDIFSVLQGLPDNTQKLIKPRNVRDAFLSGWANSTFKLTTPSILSGIQNEYIGVDSGDPDNRDVKNKIFIGKRAVGNLDIMTSSLLNSDTDIFFFNTKPDNLSQNSTKLSILSGTSSTLNLNAPYIQSLASQSQIDLNIVNPSVNGGAINIISNSGRVGINGIPFPTVQETIGSASNGMILRYKGTYPNGFLEWDEATVNFNDIGVPGQPTNLYGDPVNVNGWSLEFVDDRSVPEDIGNILQGASFSSGSFNGQDWPLSKIIEEVLYPYIEPVLELSVENNLTGTKYAERGATSVFNIDFTLTTFAREEDESVRDFILRESTSSGNNIFEGGAFIDTPGSSTFSSLTHSINSNSNLDIEFWVSTKEPNNNETLFGFSFSSTESIHFINPIFVGFSELSIPTNTTTLKAITDDINKIIEPKPDSEEFIESAATYNDPAYFYYITPNSYSNPKLIKDPNGFVIYDDSQPQLYSFTQSTTFHSDYSINYKILRLTHLSNYDGVDKYKFIY